MPTMPSVLSAACSGDGGAAPSAHVVEDLYGFLHVLSDGTVLRSPDPVFCPITFPRDHPAVQWRDAVFDTAKNLSVRMYKPAGGEEDVGKLPVLVYFHGGGFCLGSCTWANAHSLCLRLAADAGAVVLSAGYRLAPEHRLPAALDDAEGFVAWLRGQSVDASGAWLTDAADFGRVFITGDSAGGTMAHHLAVRGGGDLGAVTIRGYILLMPFFGGELRTPSEADPPAATYLSLDMLDRFWRLSLPAGATRDHPIANPFGPESPCLDAVDFPPVLVVAGGLDIMRDRVVDYAQRLAALGKPVELTEFAGEPHGFFTLDTGSEATGELIRVVRRFVDGCVAAAATETTTCA